MPKVTQRLIGRVGMALGIVVIVGSVIGGVALAADLGRTGETDTGVPVSNDDVVAPDDTGTPGGPDTAGSTPPPAGGDNTSPGDHTSTSMSPGEPATTPPTSPTCWTGPGEHPDGIEDCEDDQVP